MSIICEKHGLPTRQDTANKRLICDRCEDEEADRRRQFLDHLPRYPSPFKPKLRHD